MKYKIILSAFLVFNVLYTNAQDAVATQDEINKFYKTKTYVVFDSNIFGSYNKGIKKAIEQNWTLTEVEFIDETKYSKMKYSYRNSFMVRTKVKFTKDKSKTAYTFLSLLLGSKKGGSMSAMPDLCSFPLSYYNVDYDKYIYKLGAIVMFMQNHVKVTQENPNLSSKNILKYYSKNAEELGNKTLYVLKDELASDVNTISKIKAYYSGNVKIVEPEIIKKAIADKDPNVVFLHKVGPDSNSQKMRIYKVIMGASDGKLYYFNYHKYKKGKAPDAFLAKDFKSL
ncbi:MAG: hypothetical protein DRI95_03320 [Bacteroidetes bacterium]|nr:MAG: hypothetical protein DRI95_03320 [Bacteroidota bacterium]